MSPSSVSPVLKTNITFTVDSSYTGVLTKEDLTVTFVDSTNSSNIRYSRVISADDANKQFTVIFGGAVSGTYITHVNSASYGQFDASAVTLTAEGKVLSYTPTSGSANGGTLITITGMTFGTVSTDNPVKIGGYGG